MGLISRLFGAAPRAPEPSRPQLGAGVSVQAPMSEGETRRELLRVVLRDMMHRQGIPPDWIGAEMLTTTARNGQRGVHWRLLVKHWDPRILGHGVAIQQALLRRVTTFDPSSTTWLNGISWQFALADDSVCPSLPRAGSWKSPEVPASAPETPPQTMADIMIGGPVPVTDVQQPAAPRDTDTARADLDALLAVRDADFQKHAEGDAPGWSRTEPAKL
jgi:hypothetical protein